MLRCAEVAFYDIRPGNGAGLFLQPRSLYGTRRGQTDRQTDVETDLGVDIISAEVVTLFGGRQLSCSSSIRHLTTAAEWHRTTEPFAGPVNVIPVLIAGTATAAQLHKHTHTHTH